MISLSVCYTPWVPHSQMVVCSWHVRSTLGIASESLEWEQMPPGHQLIYPLASPDEQNCILFISCWPQFQVSEVSLVRPYSTSVLQISMAMVQEVAVVIENRNTSIVRDEQRCHPASVHVPGDGSEHRMSSCLGVPLVLLASARSRLAPEMCFVIASTTQKVRKNVDNHMGKCTYLLVFSYCIVLNLFP